jgi:uracil-DNA glycosylase
MNETIGIKNFGEQWYRRLRTMLEGEQFANLGRFLASERMRTTVYPERDNVFKAFQETPFNDVKIVILGQDPYHNGSATGLAFANPNTNMVPQPSLKRVLLEVENDVYNGFDFNTVVNFDLTNWASQGVLLLNTALTTVAGKAGSHTKQWAFFTEAVIDALNEGHSGLIWMLWGNHAKSFGDKINILRHIILEAGHPASGVYGKDLFAGCKHFSQANEILERANGKDTRIKW